MGARQSVVQQSPTASSNGDHGLLSLANSHSSTNEASTSTSNTTGYGGARPRLTLQSTPASSSSGHHHRSRQLRSRSMTTPPQFQSDAAALIAALNQQRRHANRLMVESAIGVASSDQSSDSGDEHDAMTTSTIRSLDRLLRFNSVAGTSSDAQSSSTPRVWLPPVSFRVFDIKCPICNKTIPFDDAELHLVVCLTRPKIVYNEEVLCEDRDECVICFDQMSQGDTIARLPCLCVYHKGCIDGWFKIKNNCPAHPGDD